MFREIIAFNFSFGLDCRLPIFKNFLNSLLVQINPFQECKVSSLIQFSMDFTSGKFKFVVFIFQEIKRIINSLFHVQKIAREFIKIKWIKRYSIFING